MGMPQAVDCHLEKFPVRDQPYPFLSRRVRTPGLARVMPKDEGVILRLVETRFQTPLK